MKKLLTVILGTICIGVGLGFTGNIDAYFDPREVPNNRMGVHILDPSEIEAAAKLINSSGGEWGYVTIPIRADDRDQEKWETFFEKARQLKVIPIIRLTSWFPGEYWHIPTDEELLYFANFLDQMPWPVENRYVVVFNEPNHIGEWGGSISPEEYARKLRITIETFKGKNEDYFILPAAMDRAAPNGSTTMTADEYWRRVFAEDAELANLVDGWNVHAYPNPGFSGLPTDRHGSSIIGYQYEIAMLRKLGRSDLPIFITEVGWSRDKRSDEQIAQFWRQAWDTVWVDENIVSINVWILQAHDGPFEQFTLIEENGEKSIIYDSLFGIEKITGQPVLHTEIGGIVDATVQISDGQVEGAAQKAWWDLRTVWDSLKDLIRVNKADSSRLEISGHQVEIEVADDDKERQLGLGFRESLEWNKGMLFVYDRPGNYGFWMKNTLIPLDMIWVKDGRVVDIEHRVPVETDPTNPTIIYHPNAASEWILEVNGGWAEAHGIEIGDEVIWNQ